MDDLLWLALYTPRTIHYALSTINYTQASDPCAICYHLTTMHNELYTMFLFSLHHCVDGVELYVFTFTINSNLYLQYYALCTMYIYMFCVLKTSMKWGNFTPIIILVT